jgi:hypothetical protein
VRRTVPPSAEIEEQIDELLLAEANAVDEAQDQRFGQARVDELPQELVEPASRRARLQEPSVSRRASIRPPRKPIASAFGDAPNSRSNGVDRHPDVAVRAVLESDGIDSPEASWRWTWLRVVGAQIALRPTASAMYWDAPGVLDVRTGPRLRVLNDTGILCASASP